MIIAAMLLLAQAPSSFTFEVRSGAGLTVSLDGVPIIRNSWFQYYEPGWTKGYYSSLNGAQRVQKLGEGKWRVDFDTGVQGGKGFQTYEASGDTLKVHCEFDWDGEHPVKIETTAATLWAPALETGSLTADGNPTRPLNAYAYQGSDLVPRRFGPDSKSFAFTGPLGTVSEVSSEPLTLFDARGGYKEDWASTGDLFWLGDLGLLAERGKPALLDLEWKFDPKPQPVLQPLRATLTAQPVKDALLPDESRPVLIPKPKEDSLDWDSPMELTGAFTFPAGVFDHLDEFRAALARRFVMPEVTARTPKVAIDAGISKLGYVPGGYRITIRPASISVLGEEDDGLRLGLERLARLAFIKDGKLMLPTGYLADQPQNAWRGVHLFVGPKALPFQERLWTRVLRPLGFNKVVLQCERTAWDATPGIETPITMSKENLVRLFTMYRDMGVDPIPLIESYGHMEWLFENGQNLDLAFNPATPYAVDPRKPAVATLLSKLWDEVIATLRPDTIHFGLDEVTMLGFNGDPALSTRLWATQLNLLGGIARSHDVQMMLWGDEALAPTEAPDATNGDDKDNAAARRAAIPKGSLIGDWHYLDDADYRSYTKNLQLWKDNGLVPIASTWYKPNNIHGFDVDAGLLGVGTLQTTWCGYDSNEQGMLAAMPQFSAMVLAADYGWSGRNDDASQLGYDPAEVFRQMYFDPPSPLTAQPGVDLLPSSSHPEAAFTVGNVKYDAGFELTMGSDLAPVAGAASDLDLTVAGKGRELAIAMQTLAPGEDGDPVADLTIELANGSKVHRQLKYGEEVRAAADRKPLSIAARNDLGMCSMRIDFGSTPQTVRSVSIKPLNTYTGLKVLGLEIIE